MWSTRSARSGNLVPPEALTEREALVLPFWGQPACRLSLRHLFRAAHVAPVGQIFRLTEIIPRKVNEVKESDHSPW